MKLFCTNLWQDTQGQDLVEYALMVGLAATAAVAAMNGLSGTITTLFTNVGAKITTAGS